MVRATYEVPLVRRGELEDVRPTPRRLLDLLKGRVSREQDEILWSKPSGYSTEILNKSLAHLFRVIVGPVLPEEVQQAVLAVLEKDRALGGIRVDEVGVPAPECAAGLECQSSLCHRSSKSPR